ncbi:thiamine phosphate synthase [Aurantiacibacter hainanensis]|uniref:thiamine phosphate synthase n=1 Tax=Aurantiacibacter hainanensis TaxID=3076114 RepID=UPI0030C752B6
MNGFHSLPNLWLLSDERNDSMVETALAALPRGNAFVFRHYHLNPAERKARFDRLAAICRRHDHLLVLSGTSKEAQDWGADGAYGPARKLDRVCGIGRFATVHDLLEMSRAERYGIDAMFLSPVFPTRSHPDGSCLGKEHFLFMASKANAPVIALGGMNAERAAELGWNRWAAIDGLS